MESKEGGVKGKEDVSKVGKEKKEEIVLEEDDEFVEFDKEGEELSSRSQVTAIE